MCKPLIAATTIAQLIMNVDQHNSVLFSIGLNKKNANCIHKMLEKTIIKDLTIICQVLKLFHLLIHRGVLTNRSIVSIKTWLMNVE